MPVSPLAVQVRFRNKYVKRPRRPQMPSQVHRGRAASAASSSTSTVRGVTRQPLTASYSSLRSMDSMASSSDRSISPRSPNNTHVHLHVGQISVTTPMVARTCPAHRATPAPAAPTPTPPNPATWMGWAQIQMNRLQPALGYVGSFIMFFVERIGFGINLNQLFALM